MSNREAFSQRLDKIEGIPKYKRISLNTERYVRTISSVKTDVSFCTPRFLPVLLPFMIHFKDPNSSICEGMFVCDWKYSL